MADEPSPERIAKVTAQKLANDESRSGPWTEVKFGPEGPDRYIAEERRDDTYAYVWQDFMIRGNRERDRIWWPAPAEPIDLVLQKCLMNTLRTIGRNTFF